MRYFYLRESGVWYEVTKERYDEIIRIDIEFQLEPLDQQRNGKANYPVIPYEITVRASVDVPENCIEIAQQALTGRFSI